MNKHLILPVTCANELASDLPHYLAIEINSALKQRIQQLAKAVTDLNVASIDDDIYSGTWSTACFDQGDGEEKGLSVLLEELESSAKEVEVKTLTVAEHGFWFTGIPKYYSDDMRITTNVVGFSELNTENSIIKL